MSYVFNDEKMFMDVSDGIAVVINTETGIYYGMNGFSTCLFDALTQGVAVEQIIQALKELPGAPSDITGDFDVFVQKLLHYNILLPGSTDTGKVVLDADTAKADDYVIEVEAYSDAQEMLLADPVHEVKEETGWTPEKESIGYSKEETREREKKVKA